MVMRKGKIIPGLIGTESDDEMPIIISEDEEESGGGAGDDLDPNAIPCVASWTGPRCPGVSATLRVGWALNADHPAEKTLEVKALDSLVGCVNQE